MGLAVLFCEILKIRWILRWSFSTCGTKELNTMNLLDERVAV